MTAPASPSHDRNAPRQDSRNPAPRLLRSALLIRGSRAAPAGPGSSEQRCRLHRVLDTGGRSTQERAEVNAQRAAEATAFSPNEAAPARAIGAVFGE
jgi:hypothetical protein